jgi:hypothetical protein
MLPVFRKVVSGYKIQNRLMTIVASDPELLLKAKAFLRVIVGGVFMTEIGNRAIATKRSRYIPIFSMLPLILPAL